MQIQVAGATADAPATTVALYYPTTAAPRAIAMGPFALDVAIGAKPVDKVKALILLSHGIGGSELGHSVLAQALARDGYLVAALRHPGDNWQDRSLIEKSSRALFRRAAAASFSRHRRDPGRSGVEGSDRERQPRPPRRRARALGRRLYGAGVGGSQDGSVPDEEALPGRSIRRPDLLRRGPLGGCDAAATSGLALAQGRARSGDRRDGPGGCDAHRRIARHGSARRP